MHSFDPHNIADFYVVGISYKNTDAEIRGQFAINDSGYNALLEQASDVGLKECFVLSTCNRTEIYGFAVHPDHLVQVLCYDNHANAELFKQHAYVLKGTQAIEHLFKVGAGLDSQILGDYEIIGQIKTAVKFAKARGFVSAFLERLINGVLQTSKLIKNQTRLSGGTVSVSFAAVQFLKENVTDVQKNNLLLMGTGKIGRTTCKNLVDYLNPATITLMNRTAEKARDLAEELGVQYRNADELKELIQSNDIVIVATNADTPLVLAEHLHGSQQKIIVDLSVPSNVEPAAALLPHVRVVNVDELSKLKDETLARRQAEVPKALKIVSRQIADFMHWYEMRKHVPVLKAVKTKLKEIHSCKLFLRAHPVPIESVEKNDEKIQRVINGMATKLRVQNQKGCQYIEAINEYIATGTC